VAMIGTRGKRMVEMIRDKKKKANEGLLWGWHGIFCIIPRLRGWFTTRKEAQLLRWHDEGRKELKKDGKFRHPANAAQWGNINNHFPWFNDARSIRFVMRTDGMNPFGTRAQHIAPGLSCCRCTTFHPGYARNRNIWCWQYLSPGQSNLATVVMSTWGH
jgi:hypothetical protein